ncbi:MAG: WD40 repeat domain-containing protein [Chlorobiales bacterium]|jgi:WD40 repeat protein/tetratricopeptide (TPR) repeat protein|nr:WD40 repeat domain-containing protein [Chlorobiales bacterium]
MPSFFYESQNAESILEQFKKYLLREPISDDLSEEVRRQETYYKLQLQMATDLLNTPSETPEARRARATVIAGSQIMGEMREPFIALKATFRRLDAFSGDHHPTLDASSIRLCPMLNWRMSLWTDKKRIEGVLRGGLGLMLLIPEAEKELIKQYDAALRLYKDATTEHEFIEALSKLMILNGVREEDSLLQHCIGLLYLYVPSLLNPQYAENYFRKAALLMVEKGERLSPQLLVLLAGVETGKAKATLALEKLINRSVAESLFQAGIACYVRGEFLKAADYAARAYDLYPEFSEAGYLLAKAYIGQGSVSDALTVLEKTIHDERFFAIKSLLDNEFIGKKQVVDLYISIKDKIVVDIERRIEKCKADLLPGSEAAPVLKEIERRFDRTNLLNALLTLDELEQDRAWKLTSTSFKLKQMILGHELRVNSIRFSPDNRLMASASSKTIISDPKTGEELRTLVGHSVTEYVYSLDFSHNGLFLASAGSDRRITLWSVKVGLKLKTLEGHKQSINVVRFNYQDSILASASSDGKINLWDVESGRLIKTLLASDDGVNTLSFSPNGGVLASAGWDKEITLWSVDQRKKKGVLKGHAHSVTGVVFSPDGKTLCSSSWDKTIKLWDVRTGKEIRTFVGHTNGVESVKFSPDGNKIVSTSYNRNGKICVMKLWTVETGEEEQTIAGEFYGVEFSPDGVTLAVASRDKTIKLWSAPKQSIETFITLERKAYEENRQAIDNVVKVGETDGASGTEDDRRRRSDRRDGGFWLGPGDRRSGIDRRKQRFDQ